METAEVGVGKHTHTQHRHTLVLFKTEIDIPYPKYTHTAMDTTTLTRIMVIFRLFRKHENLAKYLQISKANMGHVGMLNLGRRRVLMDRSI